jgi:DnaK suppressor protein
VELKFWANDADIVKLKKISMEGCMAKNMQARPVKEKLTDKLIKECKEKLLKTKMDLLNRVKEAREKLDLDEKGGDEADQTMRLLAEQEMLNLNDRLRSQLYEIESALGRIESGAFGLCEETEEAIEVERLRAIPWTRLSIEGAEIRESMDRRYAR